jgi:hypothetical protein
VNRRRAQAWGVTVFLVAVILTLFADCSAPLVT